MRAHNEKESTIRQAMGQRLSHLANSVRRKVVGVQQIGDPNQVECSGNPWTQ